METAKEFVEHLSATLESKKREFNTTLLPQMQENYNIQSTAVQAIRSILLKKRAIHDDPYKYDSRMTEIEIPRTEPFMDSEKTSVIGSRLSHYEMMLDFLNNYYQFNTDFLGPKRISILFELNNTFLWGNFSNTSNHPNTKGLVDIMRGIFTSPDTLTSSLLKDSVSHLAKSEAVINGLLKELTVFHREEYKLLIRREIMPKINISPNDCLNPSNALKEIKKVFSVTLKKQPFYTDLIIEIIKEDCGNDSVRLRQEILNKLYPKKSEKVEEKYEENHRRSLLAGLKFLGNTAPHFKIALEKIKSNEELIHKSGQSFFKSIIKAIKQAFNISGRDREITVTISDPITQTRKKQVINYNSFEKEMTGKITLFQSISAASPAVQRKIGTMNDEVLLNLLTKYISESNELLKEMTGLDEFYKTVKPELRGKIRGIKIEVTTITNSIIKANQCRAEYTAFAEEAEQMKKLGII
ncbi:hypothetical protein [Treponema pedis]|uniref:Uncharacterized protein n=1 Tax=Treponema pedis str. T A4 TaxID=1291379 RepID=S5ZX13_9SPIR|nr:hypothetical protein [Treponema pedis]AGT44990.1 hypothetical protein TPE_2518 [Treponema pedis str. T A4]